MASEKPFKPLEESTEGKIGGFALIEQAKENPDILVKAIAIMSDKMDDPDDPLFLEHYDFDTFKREVVEPIRFLQERGFKKFIPEVQPVWGKDEDSGKKGFLLMKKVKGKEIEDLEEISPKIAKELDIFISKYFEVTLAGIMSGGNIISPDTLQFTEGGLALCNIMIGKVSGDKEEHVYLIDLYPTKTKKIYYQRIDLEKERRDWFALLDNLFAKADSKHDFLSSKAALRNYLATLERWQKHGGSKIETTPQKQEKPTFEFDVKIGLGSSKKEIEERLFRKNTSIAFLCTKDFSLYLSHLGHEDTKRKNGIDWSDIIVDGYIQVENGDTNIVYYRPADKEIRAGVSRAFKEFFSRNLKG